MQICVLLIYYFHIKIHFIVGYYQMNVPCYFPWYAFHEITIIKNNKLNYFNKTNNWQISTIQKKYIFIFTIKTFSHSLHSHSLHTLSKKFELPPFPRRVSKVADERLNALRSTLLHMSHNANEISSTESSLHIGHNRCWANCLPRW